MRSAEVAPTRPYRKTKRALSEAETRQRIVEATVELHETIGPAKTTIKAIAERAGVQRATVYNHFPDLQTLFGACNAHYYERHPMPDPTSWVGIASPTERLRVALRELYTWYEETEQMLSVGIRDIDAVPPAAREAFFGYFRHVARSLMTGRRERGRARVRTAAAVGHAISFVTWHSLARDGSLTSEEVAGLMEAMVAAPARSTLVKISASDSPARNLPLEADAQAAKDQPGLVLN